MDTAIGTCRSHKLGTSFHRTFALSRDSLSQVLRVAVRHDGLTSDLLRQETSLGTVQVEAVPRYAYATGLLSSANQPLSFGRLVMERDPAMSLPATQWLLHYHLSAPHRGGPVFWKHLVVGCLTPSSVVTAADLAGEVRRCLAGTTKHQVGDSTLRGAATAFIGTYTKPEALGNLGLLRSSERGAYEVCEPDDIPVEVFAYAVCDYWEGVLGGANTVDLAELTARSDLPALLMLSTAATNRLLRTGQRMGLFEVQRSVAPYQVMRAWRSPAQALGALYGT